MSEKIEDFQDLRWLFDAFAARAKEWSLCTVQICPKTQHLQFALHQAFQGMCSEVRMFCPELDEVVIELIVRELNARAGWSERARGALEAKVAEVAERSLASLPTVCYWGSA